MLACSARGFAQVSSLESLSVSRSQINGAINDSEVVTLMGNVHPLANAQFDQGAVAEDSRLERMVLLLTPDAAQRRKLDALTEAQQDPKSPLFRQWLSPEEFGLHFGATAEDAARVAGWLEGHGFAVEAISAGRRSIVFSGTAAQVADAFHTQVHRYQVNGRMHVANAEDPQMPKALAPVVAGILSLHDFRRKSEAHLIRAIGDPDTARLEASGATRPKAGEAMSGEAVNPENTQGNAHYLFPADFATIYDLAPLYAAGETGAGTSIAIVGRSNINLTDVNTFRSYTGLPANAPTVILDGANPGLVAGDQDEATLDVEWAGGVAPAAKVKFVAAKSTATSDGVDLAAQYIVNNKTALVMSTSFGSCESQMGASEVAFYNSLWQQAAAEGISVFVSSGDSGASGCDAGVATKGTGAAVNGLCSSPYATCVGGTEFNEGNSAGTYWGASNGAGGGSARSYIREEVWNESGSDGGNGLWASGGGISQIYTQPSWQKSVAGANSNGMRAVPDVALNAASHDGYLVELNGNWYDFGGTSASSPTFAGIMALVVQKQAGVGQGNGNPGLYAMLTANADPFHATPNGNNSVPGVGGFTASGTAYNLATGLGSVDAEVLVNGWQAASKTSQPGYTLKASVGGVMLLSGKSATFTVWATATGGFNGPISLTAGKLPAGVVVTFNPAVVKPGISAVVTVTATNSAVAGTGSMLLTGTSGSLQASTAVGLTVKMPPTLMVGVAATKMTLIQGKTATLQVKAITGGSYAGPVTLAVAGLPKGVTAKWSANGVNETGAGTLNSTLTLSAAATTAIGATTLKITAVGDGLTAQAVESMLVTVSPAISVALSPASIAMTSTGTSQVVVTTSLIGGVMPAANLAGVSFSVAGLPTGVVASWGTTTQGAAETLQATLTLTGGKNAAVGKSTLTVSAGVADAASKITYKVSQPAGVTLTLGK